MPDVSLFPEDPVQGTRPFELGATASKPALGQTLFPDDEQASALKTAVATGKPDNAARVLKMQTATGMPVPVIERNLDDIERETKKAGFDAEQFRRTSPYLSNWLAENPKHAELASDDLGTMGALEWLVTAPGRAYKQGQAQVEFGKLSSDSIFRNLSADENKRLDELRADMQRGGNLGAESWLGKAVTGGAQQLPMLFGGLLAGASTGLPAAASGMAMAAAAGQLGPQVALPEEIATVPAAGLVGYRIGSTAGAAQFGFEQESGHALEEFSKFRDELGQPLDRDVARAAAMAAGGINAGLEAFQLHTLLRTIPGADKLTGAVTRTAIQQALAQPTIRVALKDLMVGYGKTLTTETATEVAQRAVTIMSGELGKAASGQNIAYRSAGDIAGDLTQEAIDDAQAFTFIVAPGHLAGGARDLIRVREAAKNEQFFTALGQGVADSKTFQRMPEKVQEFISRATRDGPVEKVYVPVEAWQTYFQGAGADPAAAAQAALGSSEAYEEAVRTGSDIAIPMATYATKIAPTEANAFFANEVRLGADELNGREAKELQQAIATQAEDANRAADEPVALSASRVREDVTGQLIGAGFDRGSVEAYAGMHEAAFHSLGERAGIDPFELYQQYGLRIARPLPEVLRQGAKVDALDPLIDQVRAGTPEGAGQGQSLTDFLRERGGVKDQGGSLSAMDADRGRKPFQKRLVNEGGMGIDDALTAAQEAGYFPMDEADAPASLTGRDLLDAIDSELGGQPLYSTAQQDPSTLSKQQAVSALADHLDSLGVDVNALSNEEIKKIVAEASANQGNVGDVVFEQNDKRTIDVDGVARPVVNSRGEPIHWSEDGVTAFWRWFGNSKVVDKRGRPLVVYHGSSDMRWVKESGVFSTFDERMAEFKVDPEKSKEKALSERAYFFTDSARTAKTYADPKRSFDYANAEEGVLRIYLKIENPEIVDGGGQHWRDVQSGISKESFVESLKETDKDGLLISDVQDNYASARGGADPVSNVWVAFNPEQIKSATANIGTFDPLSGNILKQDAASGPRGAIRFGADRQFNIDLLARADLSTFIHESGHFYLEVFGDLADAIRSMNPDSLTDQQRQMATDYDAALKWLGVESRDQIGVEQHEQWARGLEAYMREGKAPSAGLRSVFAKFRSWLLNVYRSMAQLNVTINPEIRGVMDRVFATDQQIEAAEREADIVALFTDAKMAGMSEDEFAAYRKTVQTASERARDTLQAKLMAQLQREREAWWKEERKGVQAEVASEVYAQPEYVALSALQRGAMPDGSPLPGEIQSVKLDRAALVDVYGKEFLKRLPRPYVYAKDGGIAPDLAAELFGFKSGDELVMALANVRPVKPLIEAETDARMRERHGDMLLDGSIADAARAAVLGDDRSIVIEAEMKALRRRQREVAPHLAQERARSQREADYAARWADAERKLSVAIQRGEDQAVIDRLDSELKALKANTRAGAAMLNTGLPTVAVIRAMARGRIAQAMVRDLNPSLYLIAARKASKAATRAAATDDFNEAFVQKQRELLNTELYKAAMDARAEVDATVEYMRSFDRAPKRQRIGKAGADYLDQIDGLLDRFDFKRVPLKVLERRKALALWVAEKERQGLPVDIDPALMAEGSRQNYKEMTVEQLAGLRDTVKHIEHLASLKNKLLKAKAKRELDEVVADLDESIRKNGNERPRNLEPHLATQEAGRLAEGWFAGLKKFSFLARLMDGYKDAGPVQEYLVRPLNEAATEEASMREAATIKLAEIFAVYRGKEAAALYRKTHIPEIGGPLTKMGRVMVALNWGNEGNRSRVMDGYGWNEQQVGAILDTLDERDWKFVQAIWDFIDSYWPQIEAKEKRVDGVAPAKVEATPVQTRFGELKGGYFPIVADDRQDARAGANAESGFYEIAQQASRARASTRRGHTEARAEKSDLPVRLDFGVIQQHITQVIHDLTHHEMLIDAGRILGNKTVQAAIYATQGEQTYKQIKSLMLDVAIGEAPAVSTWEKLLNRARTGSSIAAMGWSITTALQQPTGLSQSIVRVGPKWIALGLTRWLRDAASLNNTVTWVHGKSEFMRLRHKTQLREINEISNSIGLRTGKIGGWVDEALRTTTFDHVTRQGVLDSFFWMIGKTQQLVDVPTWIGAYEKAMDSGVSEADAIERGDQAVRDSQGNGQIQDLAGVQRGGPLLKLWTNFYSYFSVTYNLLAESTGRTNFRDPVSVGRMAVDYLLLTAVPATMGYFIKQGVQHALGGDGDDDLTAGVLKENISYLFGLMVGLREVGAATMGYSGYEGPAGARFFASLGHLAGQAKQGELDLPFWKSLDEAAGIMLHYPAGQVNRTVSGINAMIDGQTINPLALIFGPQKQ